ncbi:hypothetical protein [Prevotella sp. AGR2160]|uniref:hypothetical protein n=1 Tax=Prevotella sp. AGR2160 TaxID=1280674 RepID=UPI00041FA83D|nr:hypothetical protein [Prevotella sp. AGR2160]
MGAVRNYSRFYNLLKQMPGADKETLVEQFTNGRTTHLHETTESEYRRMCDQMELVSGYEKRKAAWLMERKRKRSLCLHLMQKLGIDTSDWARIDNFCLNARICGKRFAQLGIKELEALQVKLRTIERKGGLKEKADCPEAEKKSETQVIIFPFHGSLKKQ